MDETNNHGIRNYASLNLDIPFNLTSQQKILYESLVKKENYQQKIYYGALRILADKRNPDRLSLASHNFRELLI